MASTPLRRSTRLQIYDSNGRDYLADSIGWTRAQLEAWIRSPNIQPHLQLWYRMCVGQAERFNHAIKWINSGGNGYFYNSDHLEKDLLLLCLAQEHSEHSLAEGNEVASYAAERIQTSLWSTQDLWARSAWRVVRANREQCRVLQPDAEDHAASCYGFVVELLCIAFHSLAFRGRASVYEGLINGCGREECGVLGLSSEGEEEDDEEETILTGSSVGSEEEAEDDESDYGGEVDGSTPPTSDGDDEMGDVIEVKMLSPC